MHGAVTANVCNVVDLAGAEFDFVPPLFKDNALAAGEREIFIRLFVAALRFAARTQGFYGSLIDRDILRVFRIFHDELRAFGHVAHIEPIAHGIGRAFGQFVKMIVPYCFERRIFQPHALAFEIRAIENERVLIAHAGGVHWYFPRLEVGKLHAIATDRRRRTDGNAPFF